ncbi:MAG TPA: LysR family transcriptional regulator [Casimicrobiaceae bacterium]|nr:LysR family transcriptional regulator [Casimicrobiaceae bacterium]
MDRLAAIATFIKVVEQGSFARAAERLGVSTSAVSRNVSDLEAHLGVRLLNRTTRRLSLTESGQAFLERAVQLIADLEEAEANVSAGALSPRGTLRVTCATTFGERYIAPAIAKFASRHPDLRFDVELSDRIVDLVDEGFDLAIRIGAPGSSALIARRIGATELVCCASRAYLARHGTPKVPEDLASHRCLHYTYAARDVWRFRDPGGSERAVRINGPVLANNGRFLASLARSGAGIVLEPDMIVGDEIAAGALVRLLAGFAPPPLPIYAVYASRRHLSAKVRSFVDFLAGHFERHSPWSIAARARPKRRTRPVTHA